MDGKYTLYRIFKILIMQMRYLCYSTRMKVLNRICQFRLFITQYEADHFIEVHIYPRKRHIVTSSRLMPET